METNTIPPIDRGMINNYVNSFRIAFSQYLKEGVGLQTTVFPYKLGAVIIIELDFGIPAKDIFRSDSNSLLEALKRTNLFADSPQADVRGTFIVLHQNKIILIKDNEPLQWSPSQVSSDINTISKSINKSK